MKPGVYLNLPFKDYIDADALGSSDMKTLLRAPANWWYGSKHNTDRVEPNRERHLILGSALHTLILEGEEVFTQRFTVEPDPRNHPNAAKTTDEIRALLELNEIEFKPSTLKKKQDWIDLAIEHELGPWIWDCITAQHKALVEEGRDPLKHSEANALFHMAALVEHHPEIGTALQKGLREVSVFWKREGEEDILYRARFDAITPTLSIDLKTMSNWQGNDVAASAVKNIVQLEYDIQLTLYQEAREALRQHVEAGRVWSGGENKKLMTEYELETINAIGASPEWNWVWLFYQLRDDTGSKPKAPVLVPRWYKPASMEEVLQAIELKDAGDMSATFDTMVNARLKIDKAIENFRSYRDSLGFDQPWMHVEPNLQLLDQDLAAAGLAYKGV